MATAAEAMIAPLPRLSLRIARSLVNRLRVRAAT
jgi:hypothetical protein